MELVTLTLARSNALERAICVRDVVDDRGKCSASPESGSSSRGWLSWLGKVSFSALTTRWGGRR